MPKKAERNWAMFIHLSQLLNIIIPFSGFVAVIILWQLKKDESSYIDKHGKMVTNWMFSYFLYGFLALLLVYFGIGIVLLFLLKIAVFVLAVIGAINANNAKEWRYPFMINFIK